MLLYYSSIERNIAVPENSPGEASCSPARSYTGGGLGGGAVTSVFLESQRTKPNSLKSGVHIGLSEYSPGEFRKQIHVQIQVCKCLFALTKEHKIRCDANHSFVHLYDTGIHIAVFHFRLDESPDLCEIGRNGSPNAPL